MKRESLTSNERRQLKRLTRERFRLVKPKHRLTKGMQGLLAKGYVRTMPGLFHDTPQGYAPAD